MMRKKGLIVAGATLAILFIGLGVYTAFAYKPGGGGGGGGTPSCDDPGPAVCSFSSGSVNQTYQIPVGGSVDIEIQGGTSGFSMDAGCTPDVYIYGDNGGFFYTGKDLGWYAQPSHPGAEAEYQITGNYPGVGNFDVSMQADGGGGLSCSNSGHDTIIVYGNGSCGSAATNYSSSDNSFGSKTLCSVGSTSSPAPSSLSAGQTTSWKCSGINSDGTTNYVTSCSASRNASLTVTNSGGGSVSDNLGRINLSTGSASADYGPNTAVTLTATPSAGYSFTGWSGSCSGTGSCNMTMNQNRSVTATFGAIPSINGSCGSANTHAYGPADSIWGSYSACSSGSPTPSTISLNPGQSGSWQCIGQYGGSNASCSASRNATLTLTNSGGGTITSNPSGISCSGNCSSDFAAGASVALSAAPGAGYYFAGWSGGSCSGTGSCNVSMNQNISVGASFTRTPVSGSCGSANGHAYGSSDSVWGSYSACSAGNANPSSLSIDPGTFGSWQCAGSYGGSTASCTASKNGNLWIVDGGGGTVTSNPSGINCPGSVCDADFSAGTSVTLTASSYGGYYFSGWGGSCSGTGSCIVGMNQSRTVTATFNPIPVNGSCGSAAASYSSSDGSFSSKSLCSSGTPGSSPSLSQGQTVNWQCDGENGGSNVSCSASRDANLTVTNSGGGNVSDNLGRINVSSGSASADYGPGTVVVLTASVSPNSGYDFTGWGGSCSGTGTCTLTMNSNKSVTANFTHLDSSVSCVVNGAGKTYNLKVGDSVTVDVSGSSSGFSRIAGCTPVSSITGSSGGTISSAAYVFSSDGGPGASAEYKITALSPGTDSFDADFHISGEEDGLPCNEAEVKECSASDRDTIVVEQNGSCGSANGHAYGSSDPVWGSYSACTAGTANPSTISINPGQSGSWQCAGQNGGANASCSATKNANLTILNTGNGTVVSSPAKINCPGVSCSGDFSAGQAVTLTASPNANNLFSGWGGACSGTGPCTVTMNQNQIVTANFRSGGPPTLTISPSSASTNVEGTQVFSASYDDDGSFGADAPTDVTGSAFWQTSNGAVAAMSNNVATGRSAGSASISAIYGGITASAPITVYQQTLTISPSSATMITGDRSSLSASYDPDGASGPQPAVNVTNAATWSSSNSFVATVSSNGTVTADNEGTASITASYAGLTHSANITVYSPTLTISPSSATVNTGESGNTQSFTATYDPDGASGPQSPQNVTNAASWSTSDPSVATVSPSSGIAQGESGGSSMISANYDGLSSSALLTVRQPVKINLNGFSTNPAGNAFQLSCSGGVGPYRWTADGNPTPPPPSGTAFYNPVYDSAGTFRVTCYDSLGGSDYATITVTQPSCSSFSANPSAVVPPGGVELDWSCSNVSSCTLNGTPVIGSSITENPTSTTKYTLDCLGFGSGSENEINFSTIVTVLNPGVKEINP